MGEVEAGSAVGAAAPRPDTTRRDSPGGRIGGSPPAGPKRSNSLALALGSGPRGSNSLVLGSGRSGGSGASGRGPNRPRPASDLGEMLGHVGHGLRRAGELAAALVATGFQVTPGRTVEIPGRLDIDVRVRGRSPRAQPFEPFIGTIQVASASLAGVLESEVVRRRRQVGIGPIVPRGVAGVVHGAGQVVGGGPILAGEEQIAGRLGPQSFAVERGRPIGPVAEPFLGSARRTVVGAKAAEQVISLPSGHRPVRARLSSSPSRPSSL